MICVSNVQCHVAQFKIIIEQKTAAGGRGRENFIEKEIYLYESALTHTHTHMRECM